MMNKHFYDVSFFAYSFLLVFSCMCALFADLSSANILGMIALLWATLSLLVFLWVIERVYYYKQQMGNTKAPGLPRQLIKSMRRQQFYNMGIKAQRSFNQSNIFIMICGTLYCGWMVFVALHPATDTSLLKLNDLIEGFFKDETGSISQIFWYAPVLDAVTHITLLLSVFVIYWLVQFYVYSNSLNWNIIWLALIVFFISFFAMIGPDTMVNTLSIPTNIWTGYGWSNIEALQALNVIPNEPLSYFQTRLYAVGLTGATFFYLPGFLIGLLLVRNMFSKSLDKRLPLLGLIILMIMLYVDVAYVAQIKQFSLWAAGWCLLGVVSIRERSDIRKIYRIHQ